MWYVYREYANGEAIEEAYDTLKEAKRAELFIKDYFSPTELSVGLVHKIGPFGGSTQLPLKSDLKPSFLSSVRNLFRRSRHERRRSV